MFELVTKDLGRVRVGTSRTLIFPYKDIKIISLTASCGCTDVVDDKEALKVRAIYTAKPVPKHLEQQGQKEYKVNKKIIVTYRIINDQEDEIRSMELQFNAQIYKD